MVRLLAIITIAVCVLLSLMGNSASAKSQMTPEEIDTFFIALEVTGGLEEMAGETREATVIAACAGFINGSNCEAEGNSIIKLWAEVIAARVNAHKAFDAGEESPLETLKAYTRAVHAYKQAENRWYLSIKSSQSAERPPQRRSRDER